MHKISLTSFANNYGMTQISWDEYHQHYASTEKFIFQPGSSLAKNAAGEIVGFYYTLIDPAPAFMAANGDHTRLDWSLVQKDPLWVISSVGLSDKTRGKGLLEKLGNISMNSFLAAGLKHGVASLIKEGPSIFSDLTNQSREYVVYSKPI
ncbi:MAG: hypothetical protein EOP09_17875 [Proteobacteria bacterium]|nr:MAG: hypothetical protein EOP09_17875 [Pseudomonadota bacterium]